MLKIKKPHSKKKIALISLALVAVAVGGLFTFRYLTTPDQPATPPGVKLAPASKEEKEESEANKQRLVDEKNNQNNQSDGSGNGKINVIISNAGYDSLSAYVTGVFEEGGTCTATFTQGSTTITRGSTGFANVSYTQCAPITPNLPNTNGWSVVVSYTSASGQGKSQAQTF